MRMLREGNGRKGIATAFACGLTIAAVVLAGRPEPAVRAAEPPAGTAMTRVYRSPVDVRFSPAGVLAVSDRTGGAVSFISASPPAVARTTQLGAPLGSLAWSADASRVYVAESDRASVAEISVADAKVLRRLPAGPYPNGIAVAASRNLLLVTQLAPPALSAIDLATGKEVRRVPMVREPFAVAASGHGATAVVSNLLPAGSATDPATSAVVSLVSLTDFARTDVVLPPNSTCVRGVVVSPDGRWAYAVHTVARTTLPATQIERGWVNTNALSVIDLREKRHHATVLLDSLYEGAADPWGLAIDRGGSTLWVSIAGNHELARIDLAGLHRALAGGGGMPAGDKLVSATVWQDIKSNPARRADLVNDLSALHVARLITRVRLGGLGLRGIDVSPVDGTVAVGQYFTGDVALVDPASALVKGTVSLGDQPPADDARRGEIVFHDARHTFQHWLSCATCHPNDGRVDGLNWDLMNDGLGNAKNNKSLLQAHLTAPAMWQGVREDFGEAVAAGFRFESTVPSADDVRVVEAYLRSLSPQPSPFRNRDGTPTAAAVRGRAIFNDERVKCAHCHDGDLLTNRKRFNVGTHGPLDRPGEDAFDTPSLVEVWRTAPYLHDGRAATLADVFTKHNPADKHGVTSRLTPAQVEDLVAYLLTLDGSRP